MNHITLTAAVRKAAAVPHPDGKAGTNGTR